MLVKSFFREKPRLSSMIINVEINLCFTQEAPQSMNKRLDYLEG